jgi:SulP family sulfate permease
MFFLFKKKDGSIKDDVLSGLTVSLAMVPEVVAFCFVAGVDPIRGLHATFMIAIIAAILGGRPGMVSGSAGALAVVIVSLVASHGIEFLFAAVVLAGILQLAAGVFRLGKFVRLIPHPVMLGFVNGLAIVIFWAQMGQFKSIDTEATKALLATDPAASSVQTWLHGQEMVVMLGLVILTMVMIQLIPKISKAIPASLVAIITVTLLSIYVDFGVPVRTVFDQLKDMMPMGTPLDQIGLTGDLPKFHIPDVPFVWESIKVILPYSVILCLVGLIESLMTLSLIDEITETRGNSNRECLAQGLGNLTNGFFGSMGGCAMIGKA